MRRVISTFLKYLNDYYTLNMRNENVNLFETTTNKKNIYKSSVIRQTRQDTINELFFAKLLKRGGNKEENGKFYILQSSERKKEKQNLRYSSSSRLHRAIHLIHFPSFCILYIFYMRDMMEDESDDVNANREKNRE